MWIMCCVWTALEKQIIYFSMFRNLQKRELLLFLQLRYVLYVVGTIHFQVKRILISNILLYNYKHLLFTRDERNLVLPWELTSPTLCPHFACDGCSNNSSSSQQQLKKQVQCVSLYINSLKTNLSFWEGSCTAWVHRDKSFSELRC